MELGNIKRIREITSEIKNNRPYRGGESPVKQVNEALEQGWILLDIHRRVYRPDDSVEEHHSTVYILGHTEAANSTSE